MKATAARAAGGLLVAACVVYLLHAAWVWRVCDMAHAWETVPVSVPWWAFLSLDARAATASGIFADVAFVRLPTTARSLGALTGDPLPPRTSPPQCYDSDRFRYNPQRIAPQDLGACYGVARWFDAGEGNAPVVYASGDRGGFVLLDRARGRVYIAVWRVR